MDDMSENEIGESEYPPITPWTWVKWCGATIAMTTWLAVALGVVAALIQLAVALKVGAALIRILMKGAGMG